MRLFRPPVVPPKWSVDKGRWNSYPPNLPSGPVTPVPVTDEVLGPDEITAAQPTEVSRALVLAFAFVIATACRFKREISVLDFGGGLGGHYRIARNAVPDCKINYTVQELPELCAVGSIARPDVRFVSEATGPYDLVVASGALHCVEDWAGKFAELAALAPLLYVTRVMVFDGDTKRLSERLPNGIASAWGFGRDEFLSIAGKLGLTLLHEFAFQDDFEPIAGSNEKPKIRGFLFRR